MGRGPYPLPRNFFDFLSGNGAFWCILGASFNVSIRHVKQSRKAVANWSVISHGGRINHDIIHINTLLQLQYTEKNNRNDIPVV